MAKSARSRLDSAIPEGRPDSRGLILMDPFPMSKGVLILQTADLPKLTAVARNGCVHTQEGQATNTVRTPP